MAAQETSLSQASQASLAQPVSVERSKYQSPPPAQASMTPPPSSQAAFLSHHVTRTPTPTHSHLSSPPPTIKAHPSQLSHGTATDLYSSEQVEKAGTEELRKMLTATGGAYREAKASAASLNLQYNLLLMETSEAMKRKDVELDMALKEVEVARNYSHRGSALAMPPLSHSQSPSSNQMAAVQAQVNMTLKDRVKDLELDNENLHHRYEELRLIMREREASLYEENERLRERIRANRKHLNLLRTSSGVSESSPFSILSTPAGPTPHAHGGQLDHTTSLEGRDGDAFSQLLLADQVLSQEANTTPSTPTPHQARRGIGHHRGVQSLSSLPSTPLQAQSVPAASRGRAQYYTPRHARSPPVPQTAPVQRYRQSRRESRDSTISASDIEDEIGEESETDREDIAESQASQEARKLLNRSASFNRSAASSQRSEGVARSSNLLQSKLYGPVTKPGSGVGKRKASSEASPLKTKKGRSNEVIGLGIGGWANSGR